MRRLLAIGYAGAGALTASALAVYASVVWSEYTEDVVILGEVHDNPAHHHRQHDAVNEISPKAVVYEMLTPAEAAALAQVPRTPGAMRAAVTGYHWSNIADYTDILSKSPVILGAALPPDALRKAFDKGAADAFGAQADIYGLSTTLPEAQQKAREALQFAAHCDAMPMAMMGGMVEAQRLRDAAFARSVIEAVDTYGTPVVLITGNGHARTDWGVPSYLARVRPDLEVISIGQGEAGSAANGAFEAELNDAPRPTRADPCAGFQKQD